MREQGGASWTVRLPPQPPQHPDRHSRCLDPAGAFNELLRGYEGVDGDLGRGAGQRRFPFGFLETAPIDRLSESTLRTGDHIQIESVRVFDGHAGPFLDPPLL